MSKKGNTFPQSAFGGSTATTGASGTGGKPKGKKKSDKNKFPSSAFGGKSN